MASVTRRRLRMAGLCVVLLFAVVVVTAGLVLRRWMQEGSQLGRVHLRHEVSHPGWSFPGRVYSLPVPLDAPPERLVAEARARAYTEDCSRDAASPGTFCPATGRVVPRSGSALEPVLLGWLIGPDAEVREHLPLEDAPEHLIHAIIAAEDREFRQHSGVNLRALIRAVGANLEGGTYAQGGSTLTMQVVRTLSQQRVKTLRRKLEEIGLALGLDRELGKDGVLQMYLDAPYLGQHGGLSICGFAAAARHYFGKEARALTVAEAATLAALLPSPGTLGDKIGTDDLHARSRRVLLAMQEVFGDDVEAALAERVKRVEPQPLSERHPSYLSATRLWLEARLEPEVVTGRGLVVETGIDLPLQAQTEQLLPEKLRRLEPGSAKGGSADAPLQVAAVALDPANGLMRAVFGGVGATATSLNRALQSRRQPGSSFKPVVFALAFSQRNGDGRWRYTAASTTPNRPRDFAGPDGPWRPRNLGAQYTETAALAYALVASQNVATAALLEQLGGPEPLITFADRLGFDTSSFPREPGLALGQAEVSPLEMAEFAALIANGGRRVDGRTVFRARDRAGVEHIAPPEAGAQVLDPHAAALTRELMRGVIQQGTGTTTRGFGGEPGHRGPAIGKTGTTDAEKDVWFVGATPSLAASLWIGYDQPARVGASASELAAPLWGWWLARALPPEKGGADFPEKPALLTRSLCAHTGRLAGVFCHSVRAPFIPGTEPAERCVSDHLE